MYAVHICAHKNTTISVSFVVNENHVLRVNISTCKYFLLLKYLFSWFLSVLCMGWCCLFYYIRILFAIPCWNISVLQLHHFIFPFVFVMFRISAFPAAIITFSHFIWNTLLFSLHSFNTKYAEQNVEILRSSVHFSGFTINVWGIHLPFRYHTWWLFFIFFIFFFDLNVSIHVIRSHDISSKSKLKLELLWN